MNKTVIIGLGIIPLCGCSHEVKNAKEKTELQRPNILFCIADDASYKHFSANGCNWASTPGFDRVAGDGILFRNAYTPNSKSSPSRSCLLTGRNSWQLEEAANHVPFFPPKFTSFIEVLGNNGYTTGYTAKGWAPGIALDSTGNPRSLTGRAFNEKKTAPPANGISGNDYAGNFEDFLNSKDPDKPFCFWYGSQEPHRRYQFGSGISIGGKKITDIEKVPRFWPDDDIVRNDMLDYAFEIEHFDNHLEKMLGLLEQRGELSNTIVIVTADNGMPFPRVKGQAYEYSNHMPLAIMWEKGIKNAGRTVYDYISFIDIAPTLLDVAGIEQAKSGMQPIQGRSIAAIFKSRKKGFTDESFDHVLLGRERNDVGRPDDAGYPVRGIVKDGFIYLRNFKPERWPAGNPETGYLNTDGGPTKTLILNIKRSGRSGYFWDLCFGKRPAEELYNITSDRECINNLADKPEFNSVKQSLNNQLEKELTKQGDPRILGIGDMFDNYIYAEERTRDFYNRYMKGELSADSAGWVDSTDFEKK